MSVYMRCLLVQACWPVCNRTGDRARFDESHARTNAHTPAHTHTLNTHTHTRACTHTHMSRSSSPNSQRPHPYTETHLPDTHTVAKTQHPHTHLKHEVLIPSGDAPIVSLPSRSPPLPLQREHNKRTRHGLASLQHKVAPYCFGERCVCMCMERGYTHACT